MLGSSPHTWGRLLLRLIRRTGSAVHPHTRGADIFHLSYIMKGNGSSPHTWGRLCRILRRAAPSRFIPTHVGQTSGAPARASHAHGSSPHTWGRLRLISLYSRPDSVHPHTRGADGLTIAIRGDYYRFIPTHVGQTAASLSNR